MSSIFSEKDSNVKVLIPKFRGMSLYYNNKSQEIGFLDTDVFNAYPELKDEMNNDLSPLAVKDLNKRHIYLMLKHSRWISPILLKCR